MRFEFESKEYKDCYFYPLTIRTLHSLIRISTAFAKTRISLTIEKEDVENAVDLLKNSFYEECQNYSNYIGIDNDINKNLYYKQLEKKE